MKFSVTKEFSFNCAHILPGHNDQCRNLHGHTYKLLVTVEPRQGLQTQGSSEGMVVDFKELSQLVHSEIIRNYDHAVIIDGLNLHGVNLALQDFAVEHGLKWVSFTGRTTCENMAEYFLWVLRNETKESPFEFTSVKLYESATSYAEVTI